jgi:hypothetical protein
MGWDWRGDGFPESGGAAAVTLPEWEGSGGESPAHFGLHNPHSNGKDLIGKALMAARIWAHAREGNLSVGGAECASVASAASQAKNSVDNQRGSGRRFSCMKRCYIGISSAS